MQSSLFGFFEKVNKGKISLLKCLYVFNSILQSIHGYLNISLHL